MRALFFVFCACLGATAANAGGATPTTSRFVLVTAAGPIGTLTSVAQAKGGVVVIDNDWRVDDNGRGSKITEHAELGSDGLPKLWSITGKAWFGAPVAERFQTDGKQATWTTLDDQGAAPAAGALYVANNGTPWAMGLYLKTLLASKEKTHAVLPAGSLRAEKIRDVEVGTGKNKEKLTAWALWGLDTAPSFLLARKDALVATLSPGWVLVEERHAADFAALSTLAGELSASVLKDFTRRLTHKIDGALWINNVRVFDTTTGKLSASTSVGVYRDTIVAVGEAAPADAVIVDGGGGTLLPGLFDAHAHLSDWAGPLHLAAGVTFGRDPGNDNDMLLLLESQIDDGEIMGPQMTNSGFLEGKSPFSAHLGFVIDSAEEAKAKVRWYADHGYWGVKIYNSMNPDFVKPIAEEAHRLGMHVSGHVPAFMSSERAIRDGYDEVTHINQLMLSLVIDPLKDDTRTPFRFTALGERMGTLDLKSPKVQALVKLMQQKKTSLDPTMATFNSLLMARPGKACPADATWLDHMPSTVQRARATATLDVKPEQLPLYDASWQRLEQTLLMLHNAGIVLVPGTDDYAGFVLLSELETWARAGIPAADVITAATLGSARFVGLDGQQGRVARGQRADLVLVDGDPTKDITVLRKGRLVLKGGAAYFPDDIHAALGVKPFATHPVLTPAAR